MEMRRVAGKLAIDALDELSRTRPLTQDEALQLERAVRRTADRRDRWYWSLADDYRLFRYLLRGKKPKQIAILMGRSEQAIWTRVRDLGVRVRKLERLPRNSPMAAEPQK